MSEPIKRTVRVEHTLDDLLSAYQAVYPRGGPSTVRTGQQFVWAHKVIADTVAALVADLVAEPEDGETE